MYLSIFIYRYIDMCIFKEGELFELVMFFIRIIDLEIFSI